VTDRQWAAFLDAHCTTGATSSRVKTLAERKRDTLTRLRDHDARVARRRGTAWGVIQAVNTYTDHERTVRGADRAERNMLRAIDGGADTTTLATLRRALA
jgi:hypothetical protein